MSPSTAMINHKLNPDARLFNLNGLPMNQPQESSTPHQVSAPPSPYLEARIFNLEEEHGHLRGEVDTLKELYHDLCNTFGKETTGDRPVDPNGSQDAALDESRQSAMRFNEELEYLSREVRVSVHGHADEQKANSQQTLKANGSVPPHMRAASVASHGSGGKSLPPHLRGGKQTRTADGNGTPKVLIDTTKHKHEPLVTDGPIDTITRQTIVPAAAPSPPLSPTTTIQGDSPSPVPEAVTLSLKEWKPYYITTLASLPADMRMKIPAQRDMSTFTFDMLQNLFGGISWSPGMRYINTTGACLLQNHTYYMLDPTNEPYLPKVPGEHGAKLTAFFNKAPEEVFDNLPEGTNSYTDVPMFVRVAPGRYVYYGNYSQTRWSDKLDNDTTRARVPQHIKQHIAEELTAKCRDEWVTRELKKHFFPMPEYNRPISTAKSEDSNLNSVDEEKHHQQMVKDINEYVEELAEWEREASMKTAMIKPKFILDAFDAADADDPPALRLWWEYLECVDWKKDFYNMLVGIQARADNPK